MALKLMLLLVVLKLIGVTVSYASETLVESSARVYFSAQCWEAPSVRWPITCYLDIPQHLALTRWSAWARSSRASYGLL